MDLFFCGLYHVMDILRQTLHQLEAEWTNASDIKTVARYALATTTMPSFGVKMHKSVYKISLHQTVKLNNFILFNYVYENGFVDSNLSLQD